MYAGLLVIYRKCYCPLYRVLSALGVVAEQPQLIEDILITKKVSIELSNAVHVL